MSELMSIDKFWFDKDEFDCFTDFEGDFWFNATQVCKILSFTNVSQTLMQYTDDDERKKIDGDTYGNPQDVWYINEFGLYGLILEQRSKKSEIVRKFKRWLKREVLPSIRRSRVYISPDATSADIISAAQDRGISLALDYT